MKKYKKILCSIEFFLVYKGVMYLVRKKAKLDYYEKLKIKEKKETNY